jgi:hypothetical protein
MLPFTGSGVRLYGVLGPDQGRAEILIDGAVVETVDGYAPEVRTQVILYENEDLPWGYHEFTVRTLGTKNPQSSGTWVSVDAAEVHYGGKLEEHAPLFTSPSPMLPVATEEPRAAGRSDETYRGDSNPRMPTTLLLGAGILALLVVGGWVRLRRWGARSPSP